MRKWIKKIVFTLWLIFGMALIATLIIAMRKKDQSTCKNIIVQIENNKNNNFLSEKEIQQLLTANNTNTIIEKPLHAIDLRALENILLANIWIQKANLFFDNNNILHIHILERSPIARIFDIWGKSFYIDSNSIQLPLVSNINIQLPVFTNFSDSLSFGKGWGEAIKNLSNYILKDSFLMAQIQQIDITPDRTFEIIPTIGNHTILFGDANNYIDKFKRLKIFYEKAWAKVGLEKYAILDLRFNKQIVATRKGAGTISIDTLQAQQLMQKFMQQHPQQIDSLGFISPPLGELEGAVDTATIANTIDQLSIDTIPKLDTNTIKRNKPANNKLTNHQTIKNNKQKIITKPPVIKKPKVHL